MDARDVPVSPVDELPPELAALISRAIQDGIAKGLNAGRAAQTAVEAVPDIAPITITEMWNAWEEKNPAKAKSKLIRSHKKKLIPFFGGKRWEDCNKAAADDYYAAQAETIRTRNGKQGPPSATYVHRQLNTLCAILGWHVRRGTIKYNPMSGFTRPDEEVHARQTILAPDERERFLEHLPPVGQDIAATSYGCVGLRHGEARELLKTEVHLEEMYIQLDQRRTKARRGRVIPFEETVREILRRNMENSRGSYVFVAPDDPKRQKPVIERRLQRWVAKARKLSGVHGFADDPVVFHTLRHTAATDLITDNAQETFVKQAGGFSARTILRYTKFKGDQLEALREKQRGRLGPKKSDDVGASGSSTPKSEKRNR